MSPKQWFALLCFYFAYLWAGGSLYYHIEHQVEAELREQKFRERSHISGNDQNDKKYSSYLSFIMFIN